jgi:hypothetical protein
VESLEFNDRLLTCEAMDCMFRIIFTDDPGWIYYEDDAGDWHYYHYECFEQNEVEVIADERL